MNKVDFLYDKNIDCPICKHTYTTKKVKRGFIRAVKHDTDFCSYYSKNEFSPLLYYVNVCPACGFSMSEEFSPGFPFRTEEIINDKIRANWGSMNFCKKRSVKDAIHTYKLAIYSGVLKKEKHVSMGGLYLRLAWLYRTEQMELQENRFLKLALEEYVASYINDDFSGTHLTELKVLYLIGELSRRSNEEAQAALYFSKIIEKQKKTEEKVIVEMAKDRWREMREMKQKWTVQ
ncbi:DUF2225 domain-containing protein [Metabacillus idriensis]|uniref:DUF2225 domain-containing protein n=1 Tax=Metabacillus idriensis TaxID=324768 RepID=UPI002814028D|nr:DUF2225 domain-containing protein [Metabacillus idriensis]MDR0139925.1 DUF2225 domain-containing protein [Metabacillus idriensis]